MGTCPPKFSDCFLRPLKPEPGRKKKDPLPCMTCRSVRLYLSGRCQTTTISAPRLPYPPRWATKTASPCRDTTSCVRVGSLSSRKQRVKKHRCHNRCLKITFADSDLRDSVLQKRPVNTASF